MAQFVLQPDLITLSAPFKVRRMGTLGHFHARRRALRWVQHIRGWRNGSVLDPDGTRSVTRRAIHVDTVLTDEPSSATVIVGMIGRRWLRSCR